MTERETATFDMYFCSIASFQFHPRASLHNAKVLTLQECAEKALEMMQIRKEILERN